jgi:diguanylate cyclase (GGDEF)-like protein/PAS domain S-box-containing protein
MESPALMDAVFDGLPVGAALYSTRGGIIRVNAALCTLLGRPPGQLLGLTDSDLTHPDDDADAFGALTDSERRFVRPDGTVAWALVSVVALPDMRCWVGTFLDITERRRSVHRLRHMADRDPLTGIANRRRLMGDLELHLAHAARANEHGAVLLLDLDGFKQVNDTQGHEAGDEALATIAIGLRRRLRLTDALGRIGGDEFAVVLPHVDSDDARRVGEELIDGVRESAPRGVTASCGIALYGPDEHYSADELLALADRAMYAAKRAGRNTVRLAPSAPAFASE